MTVVRQNGGLSDMLANFVLGPPAHERPRTYSHLAPQAVGEGYAAPPLQPQAPVIGYTQFQPQQHQVDIDKVIEASIKRAIAAQKDVGKKRKSRNEIIQDQLDELYEELAQKKGEREEIVESINIAFMFNTPEGAMNWMQLRTKFHQGLKSGLFRESLDLATVIVEGAATLFGHQARLVKNYEDAYKIVSGEERDTSLLGTLEQRIESLENEVKIKDELIERFDMDAEEEEEEGGSEGDESGSQDGEDNEEEQRPRGRPRNTPKSAPKKEREDSTPSAAPRQPKRESPFDVE